MKNVSKTQTMIQMPFRCQPELQERIIRALGEAMSKSGKKISKNDFIARLVENALVQMESTS